MFASVVMMQPIVNGFTGVQSPADGGHHGGAILSSPAQLSPQPLSPLSTTSSSVSASSITSVSCGTNYNTSDHHHHHLGSTRVTPMSNGAFMTRTLHMAPTSSLSSSSSPSHHGRSHHGRRHATVGPYQHSHLRVGLPSGLVGVETTSGGGVLQAGKLVRLYYCKVAI